MPQPIICCENSGIVPLPFACHSIFSLPQGLSQHRVRTGLCVVLQPCQCYPPCPSWDSAFLYLGQALLGENTLPRCWTSVWVPSNSGYSTVLWGGVEKGEKSASFSKHSKTYQLCCIQTQAWNTFMCKASHRKKRTNNKKSYLSHTKPSGLNPHCSKHCALFLTWRAGSMHRTFSPKSSNRMEIDALHLHNFTSSLAALTCKTRQWSLSTSERRVTQMLQLDYIS